MAIIINWIECQHQVSNSIEILLCEEKFIIHYSDNVIIKTEWCIAQPNESLGIKNQWYAVQQYLNNPMQTLAINLKKQGSDFRHKVWAKMCEIPVGKTLTYSELARQIDSGARAVANACRDNPFPGIIPCHRVVAIVGLGGYMGQTSGRALDIKRKLLAKEAALLTSSEGKA